MNVKIVIFLTFIVGFVNSFQYEEKELYCSKHCQPISCGLSCSVGKGDPKVFNIEYPCEEKFVKFSKSEFSEIPLKLFGKFPFLQILKMDYCGLETLKIGDFVNATGALEELSLVGNKIDTLPQEIFVWLKGLKILYMQKNHLNVLHSNCFNGLIVLEDLNLSENEIYNLQLNLLSDLKSLNKIDLSRNQIQIIQKNLFKNNIYLETINLSHNKLKYVHKSTFLLPKLKILNLSENVLKTLTVPSMQTLYATHAGLVHLTILGSIVNIIANDNTIDNLVLTANLSANNINLSNNLLTNLTISDEVYVTSKHLDISGTSILDKSLFKSIKNIKITESLNISNINLNEFPSIISKLKGLSELKTLDISSNSLDQFDVNNLVGLSSLTFLDISHNQLTNLRAENIKEILPSLKSIEIQNNPWNCSDVIFLEEFENKFNIDLLINGFLAQEYFMENDCYFNNIISQPSLEKAENTDVNILKNQQELKEKIKNIEVDIAFIFLKLFNISKTY